MELCSALFQDNRVILDISFLPTITMRTGQFALHYGCMNILFTTGRHIGSKSASRYFSFASSHDTPRTSIHPRIQSSHPTKHVNSDWVRVCCNTVPYHTILYRTTPYFTIPYRTTPDHTLPYHTLPYPTVPYHIYHTIPYHTIPSSKLACGVVWM